MKITADNITDEMLHELHAWGEVSLADDTEQWAIQDLGNMIEAEATIARRALGTVP